MNERIEKLANVWANLRAKDDRLGITYTFSEKALEKFAELIVAECAMVIERNLFQGIGWNTSRAVKRHFGMEDEE